MRYILLLIRTEEALIENKLWIKFPLVSSFLVHYVKIECRVESVNITEIVETFIK